MVHVSYLAGDFSVYANEYYVDVILILTLFYSQYQGSSSKPEILQYSVEQAIDLAQCRRAWPDVNQSNICTRRIGDQGPRPGDSGGCLSIHTDQGFRQVGIVSRSAPGLPYIFTSVAFDRNWIVQATNNLS